MKVKKILSTLALSAAVAAFATAAVNAAPEYILGTYSEPLNQYRNYFPTSYFHGYYETGDSSHGARAGLHYDPGYLPATSYVNLYYKDSNGNECRVDYTGAVSGKGNWVLSEWVTAPTGKNTASKIKYFAKQYNENYQLLFTDIVYVTGT